MIRPRDSASTSATSALFALGVFAITLWSPQVLADGDSWWHVAAGRLMIARRALITTDPFSFTLAGRPWVTHEWLSEVLFGGAFNLGGWGGVLLATALAAGGAAGLLARQTGRWITGLPQICLLILALSLCAPHLLARPHVLAWPVMVLWAGELLAARAEDRAPRWRFLPLMALWANLHGSFLFGLALIAPFALEALLAAAPPARRKVVLTWGGFGLASGAMTLLTPHGLAGVIYLVRLTALPSIAGIGEWAPADFTTVSPIEIVLLAGLLGLMLRPVKVPILRALVLVGLTYLSLQHNRHEQLLGLIGALVLAAPLGEAFAASETPPSRLNPRWIVAGAAALAVVLGTARLAIPFVWRDGPQTPVSALAAVPAGLRAAPVLNDYRFGGYLIGHGVRPYIDGRADFYGEAYLSGYGRMAAGDGPQLAQTLAGRDIRWSLLAPGSPMARALDADPAWRRIYADRWAVAHVRTP